MNILRILALAAFAAVASPVVSQELTEDQQLEATEFAISNSIFVLQHEIGHLFIAEFGLPVLGKEEDAADSLASVTLLERRKDEAEQVLIDSADGWYLSEYSKESDTYEDADFYDEHSLDIQRSFQIVCLMVGADPEAFGDVAEQYEMDADRQESCAADYQTASESWIGLLSGFRKSGTDGGKIAVTYEQPSDNYADIAQVLQDVKLLETAAEEIENTYALPRDLTFTAKECGEENAFYSYEEGGVTFCYEMFGFFFGLIEQELLNPEAAT